MKAPQTPSPQQSTPAESQRADKPMSSDSGQSTFADNRPQAALQRKFQSIADNSPAVQRQRQHLATLAAATKPAPLVAGKVNQKKRAVAPVQAAARPATAARTGATPGNGLPTGLKAGIESLSGVSMDGVNVHYNSSAPAQLQAHAYAQGHDIHLAPGQEQHLPHEAWHVVQQKQGRVQATMQMKTGVAINDNPGLEQEADVMGAKAQAAASQLRQDDGAGEAPVREKSAGQAPAQLASAYNGDAIDADAGAWADINSVMTDDFSYGAVRGENTASSAHAQEIDYNWQGSSVADKPEDWEKFTQLIGPYAVKNLVQGHLINENLGGSGEAENLVPLASSANSRHWHSVEKPITKWLARDRHNVVDYKVTPVYGKAQASLKKKLLSEFKATHGAGTNATPADLRTWVGAYIDDTIATSLSIEVSFAQTNREFTKSRKKTMIKGTVFNSASASHDGPKVSGNSGKYSNFIFGLQNTITYSAVGTNDRGTKGHAKVIDNSHAGSEAAAEPRHWDKFLRLVGPEASTLFVQGHLINQKIGGRGSATNLTPLTRSANAVHSNSVEEPIKAWLAKKPTGDGKQHRIDYQVTANYSGANAGLKNLLLQGFDATNGVLTGDSHDDLTTWLNDYIDATFPSQFNVEVRFMKSDMAAADPARIVNKQKDLLRGTVTNEPA